MSYVYSSVARGVSGIMEQLLLFCTKHVFEWDWKINDSGVRRIIHMSSND